MNHYDVEKRVAIVTGGGQGIDCTTAERILAGGAVSVWDRDQTLMERTLGELGAAIP